jgi:non-specific serine/threonine protein kinase
VATALSILSQVAQAMGDAPLARRYLETQLAVAQQADAALFIVLAANQLAALAAARGEAGLAGQLYLLALRRCVQLAFHHLIVACLGGLASVALARGQPEPAARLLGAAEARRARMVDVLAVLPPARTQYVQYEQTVAAVRCGLAGQPDVATWMEVGRLLPLEQVVAQAVALVEGDSAVETTPLVGAPSPAAPPRVSATGTPPAGAGPLTAREREVAVLVARGATNRQIAAELVIAERTAMRHVEHVFTKLGVHSRAEVGVWVARNGLDRPDGSA